jgi:hypothetical protein
MAHPTLILSEFHIDFTLPEATAMIALLYLHPSLLPRLRSGNELLVESLGVPVPPNTVVPVSDYIDSFGNRCARFLAPLATLGFPARTSSTPTRFLMFNIQTRS